MEQFDYNLLFRWFVGLGMDAEVWDVTVFSKNRERLIAGEVAQKILAAIREQASGRGCYRRALHCGRHADRGLGGAAQL